MSDQPERAFVLRIIIDADTRQQLADVLYDFVGRIRRDDVTRGVMGGSVNGAIYELLIDETQTHDKYFVQLDTYLAERKAEREQGDSG